MSLFSFLYYSCQKDEQANGGKLLTTWRVTFNAFSVSSVVLILLTTLSLSFQMLNLMFSQYFVSMMRITLKFVFESLNGGGGGID
jgi:hypothetical protein